MVNFLLHLNRYPILSLYPNMEDIFNQNNFFNVLFD